VKSTSESPQLRLTRKLPGYCRVVFDNPPLNLMGPKFVVQFTKIMTELVLLSSDDIRGDLAEAYGYVNRSLPDAALDDFVDALATRIASFDKWAIANTKRLVNAASLPPDVEIAAGWEACMTSITRPAAQQRIRALLDRGFHKPGDIEDRLGFSVGQLGA